MALSEKMILIQHETIFTDEGTIEHVKYAHVIERDGVEISRVPHRIVINRATPDAAHPMPDGTSKTTAEIIADIDAR